MGEPDPKSDKESDLDDALDDSFPASDPPSTSSPARHIGGDGAPALEPGKV